MQKTCLIPVAVLSVRAVAGRMLRDTVSEMKGAGWRPDRLARATDTVRIHTGGLGRTAVQEI